ncbi:hypothetical protein Pcinc_019245 [Petrolisthes cinctipes]|uniref:RNA helicase n=1 Tax=Petrolisthes cinctipes TaxID=88211 RepID=A0AAE1KI10_PETCI|nr:hypothetical protein Pcinc_019245 [Petrolisthes cinctipes]
MHSITTTSRRENWSRTLKKRVTSPDMGKIKDNVAVMPEKKSTELISTPLNVTHEFEGLTGIEEIKTCTLLKINKFGKLLQREEWENGKIVKNKRGSGAGRKGKSVSSEGIEKGNKKKKKKRNKKKKQPATETGSQDTSSNLENEGDGLCVKETSEAQKVKKGIKRKQLSKSEEVFEKKSKYDSTIYQGTNQSGKEKVDVSEWETVFAPPPVQEALAELGFAHPTTIQKLCLPAAIKGRKDIIGAAETGSGKTLAFVIPIIHGILMDKKLEQEAMEETTDSRVEQSEEEEETNKIDDSCIDMEEEKEEDDNNEEEVDDEDSDDMGDQHLVDDNQMSSDDESRNIMDDNEEPSDGEPEDMACDYYSSRDGIGLVKVIDNIEFDFLDDKENKGNTKEKKKLRALIVTPTRELAIQVKSHLDAVLKYTDIRSVVIIGGVASQKQERLLSYGPDIVVGTPGRLWELIQLGNDHLSQVATIRYLVVDETDRMVEQGHFQELDELLTMINSNEEAKMQRQTFVFSATLTTTHDPPKRQKLKRKMVKISSEMKIKQLAKSIGIKEDHKVYDVTRKFGTAENLTEARINCLKEHKDYYLYHFLKSYPGRTLVFCNSIDTVKRLQHFFTLLKCEPQSLHAALQQRQRLKSLERFSNNPRALLIATDVAARGLDIPNIEHVIHYHVPRTAETYIHRSGRTARAKQEGLSILLIDASEVKKYRELCTTLNRDTELPTFPVDRNIFDQVKKIIDFARPLEAVETSQRKKRSEDWLKKMAKDAELYVEEKSGDYDEEMEKSLYEGRKRKELKIKRAVLAKMLSSPLLSRNFSGRYPTQTGSVVMPFYFDNPTEKSEAGNALSVMKKKSEMLPKFVKKVQKKPPVKKSNKKKFKGFEKRRKKLQEAEEKLM